jgi:beta-ureidopropionase / N-carbamoyl-L-amino-acid hydrolase
MAKANLPLDADRLWADVMALADITEPGKPYAALIHRFVP